MTAILSRPECVKTVSLQWECLYLEIWLRSQTQKNSSLKYEMFFKVTHSQQTAEAPFTNMVQL